MKLRVWAPTPTTVEVLIEGERRTMVPVGDRGWYEAKLEVAAGVDYAFSLDGGDPLPDPRSPWQPQGIEGPSRTVDHQAFVWSDAGWRGIHLPSSVIYELHVGTFTPEGTFDAVLDRLDHLVALGVDAIELMPVNQFPGRHGWGYDGVDLYAVHTPYGGPAGLKRLVDGCHRRGLGVILDVVYNHLGPAGNFLPRFGPYFTDRYETPWGEAVNFDDAQSDEVRDFICDNAAMWLRDYHIDALRIDAVHAIFDTSACHILEQMAERVEALASAVGRPLWLIAESDLNDPRIVRRREVGGYGMDAQWSDDFHHALHAVLTGEQAGYYADFGALGDLAAALERVFVKDGRWSSFRERHHGRPATGLSGHRFLGYLQTHDQVGNRAVGDRMSQLVSHERVKIGAALVLTAPFVPMLFAGEEWAASTPFQYFTDHADPELGRAVREGRRSEFAAFGWDPEAIPDPQDPATFERSKLDWSEPGEGAHAEMLDWYTSLIALRRSRPDLLDGRVDRVRVDVDEDHRTIRVHRGSILVAVNLGSVERRLEIGPGRRLLLASERDVKVEKTSVWLPSTSCAVIGPGD